jgi:hypothetical protein
MEHSVFYVALVPGQHRIYRVSQGGCSAAAVEGFAFKGEGRHALEYGYQCTGMSVIHPKSQSGGTQALTHRDGHIKEAVMRPDRLRGGGDSTPDDSTTSSQTHQQRLPSQVPNNIQLYRTLQFWPS